MNRSRSMILLGVMFLAPTSLFAQGPTNLMGLTAETDWLNWCIEGPAFQIYTAHLYVRNPVNPAYDGGTERAVAWINGFECRVWIEGDAQVLEWHFPVDAIDAGTGGNTMVGFAEPVPVTGDLAFLATVEIFLGSAAQRLSLDKNSPLPCDEATALVHMAPVNPYPSIPGELAYLDADDPDDPLVAATAEWVVPEDIVMLLEATPVYVSEKPWGDVKALYR